MKDEFGGVIAVEFVGFGGVIAVEFVGLKSKIYSMKKIDGKASHAGKGVSIPNEFDKFKDVLFNGKIMGIKHDLIAGRDMPETRCQNILIKNLD